MVVLKSGKFRQELSIHWLAPLSKQKLITLLCLGLPVSLQLILEVGAFATAAFFMGHIGPTALAAHQIAITCVATGFMFPLGLSVAVGVRIGVVAGVAGTDAGTAAGIAGTCAGTCAGTARSRSAVAGGAHSRNRYWGTLANKWIGRLPALCPGQVQSE